ncbi:MAG: hypothetical protein FJ263_11370 [Planctomycetes bacterium]|nr:hypothetical protein [Planctomycetota bacterium]
MVVNDRPIEEKKENSSKDYVVENFPFKESKILNAPDCKDHKIFLEINDYTEFYKSLSFSVFPLVTPGTTARCNLDSYIFSSIQGTLESIKLILQNGRINDSYALTRKYHDSVVINIYANLYLQDNFSIDNFIVQKINNWLHGKEKLPRYEGMMKYIRAHNKLEKVNKLLGVEQNGHYEKIRKRCNNHTHYNLFLYMMMNDNQVYIGNKTKAFDGLSSDIRDIFILHFIWMFTINEQYMVSSDYMDSLDCGSDLPPKNSTNCNWSTGMIELYETGDLLCEVSGSKKIGLLRY